MSNLTGKTVLITGALAEGGAADAGARDNRQDGGHQGDRAERRANGAE